MFAPVHRRRGKDRVDINRKLRSRLADARRNAGGPAAPAGKVIAELPLGFWRYLSAAAHEKTLWVPCLHRAFTPGASRQEVDRLVTSLHQLRNRIAHHEPLLRTDMATRLE